MRSPHATAAGSYAVRHQDALVFVKPTMVRPSQLVFAAGTRALVVPEQAEEGGLDAFELEVGAQLKGKPVVLETFDECAHVSLLGRSHLAAAPPHG